MFRTEYDFELPLGFLDEDGTLHRHGVMRLATAADEILPLRDPRVQRNPAYLVVILLANVVTRLGTLETVNTGTVERLFAADLAYLQELYNEVNQVDGGGVAATCPQCQHDFDVERPDPGGIAGYPLDQLHEEVAFIAYHFHWPQAEVMALEHRDRRRWVEEISHLNRRMNEE